MHDTLQIKKDISSGNNLNDVLESDYSGVYYEPANIDTTLYQQYSKQPFFILNPFHNIYPTTLESPVNYMQSTVVSVHKPRDTSNVEQSDVDQLIEDSSSLKDRSPYMDIDVELTNTRESDSINVFTQITEENITECIDLYIILYLKQYNYHNELPNQILNKDFKTYKNMSEAQLTNEIEIKCKKIESIIKSNLGKILESIPRNARFRSSLKEKQIDEEQEINNIPNISTSTEMIVTKNENTEKLSYLNETVMENNAALNETFSTSNTQIKKNISTRSTPRSQFTQNIPNSTEELKVVQDFENNISTEKNENLHEQQLLLFNKDEMEMNNNSNIPNNEYNQSNNWINDANNLNSYQKTNNFDNITVIKENVQHNATENETSNYNDNISSDELNSTLLISNMNDDKNSNTSLNLNFTKAIIIYSDNDIVNFTDNPLFITSDIIKQYKSNNNLVDETTISMEASGKQNISENKLSLQLHSNISEPKHLAPSDDYSANVITTTWTPTSFENIETYETSDLTTHLEIQQSEYSKILSSRNADEITGQLFFLYDNNHIPARFIQKSNGNIYVGIDGNFLCDKLQKSVEDSVLFKKICN